MKLRLGAPALAVILLSSCLPVPFDLSISQSTATLQKMTRDNSQSITVGYDKNGTQSEFAFYPSVLAGGGFDYSAGFITSREALAVDIQGVAGSDQYSRQNQTIPNPDSHAPPYLGWPLKSGISYLFGIIFDALDPAQSSYAVITGTPPSTLTFTGNPLNSLTSVANPLGASITASSIAGQDDLHILAQDPPTQFFEEVHCTVNSSGVTFVGTLRNGGATYPLSFIPYGTTRVMYFYDEDLARTPSRSFGSWYDSSSGSWINYTWWEQPNNSGNFFSKRLPFDHRIDALLTTGQLLSTEDGTGRLYDRDGKLLASFPMGDLVYIGEQYVGGQARAYFSQCLIYSNEMHFDVYWIPSSQLTSLGR